MPEPLNTNLTAAAPCWSGGSLSFKGSSVGCLSPLHFRQKLPKDITRRRQEQLSIERIVPSELTLTSARPTQVVSGAQGQVGMKPWPSFEKSGPFSGARQGQELSTPIS